MLKDKLLKLNLQHFAEDTKPSDEANNTENTVDSNNETKKEEHMIPKARFDEVNKKYKDIQTQLDAYKNEKQEAERKAQEEAGEYQKLYETTLKDFSESKSTLETLQSRNQELEGVINVLLETKLQSVPQAYHDLIPENLTPEAKLEWINKAESKGLFGNQVKQPVGEQTNGTAYQGTMTQEEFRKLSYSEKNKLFKTNPDLYRKLSN